jgi:hypothetical protein
MRVVGIRRPVTFELSVVGLDENPQMVRKAGSEFGQTGGRHAPYLTKRDHVCLSQEPAYQYKRGSLSLQRVAGYRYADLPDFPNLSPCRSLVFTITIAVAFALFRSMQAMNTSSMITARFRCLLAATIRGSAKGTAK